VAVVGLRTALGVKPADPQALAAAVRRELTRQLLGRTPREFREAGLAQPA
jgi:hypothetical protein